MNLKQLFFLCVASISANLFAQAPISLNSTHFPSNNDTLRYSTVQPTAAINYTQTGTNFNWNFSNLLPVGQGVRSYKLGLLTPYAIFFTSLSEYGEKIADTLGAGPLTITNYYNFYKKQTTPVNAYVVDGSGMTFSSIPVPSYYSDKDELYKFPMTYPQYDSTTFKFSTASSTLIPIKYSKTGYRLTKVDGWGTITTPYGTAPCLRIVTTQYSQDSIKNTILPIPFGFANNQRSYQWLTTTSKIPYLEINGNLIGNNFTITQIRYRDIYRNITSVFEQGNLGSDISIYPNPVKDQLSLSIEPSLITQIEVLDINGKAVLLNKKTDGIQLQNTLNVSALPEGLYHLKVSSEKGPINFKFIKQ
jgi:hypothetical protein